MWSMLTRLATEVGGSSSYFLSSDIIDEHSTADAPHKGHALQAVSRLGGVLQALQCQRASSIGQAIQVDRTDISEGYAKVALG